jgi:hypothetical protein
MRVYGGSESEMPLLRYFLFVGGALLALMFAADAVLPLLPASAIASSAKLPVIRIYSESRGPEAVVLDTPIQPAVTAGAEAATVAATPAKPPESHVRESFAQLLLPQPKQVVTSEPKKENPSRDQKARSPERASTTRRSMILIEMIGEPPPSNQLRPESQSWPTFCSLTNP